jgi:hypothetical protein
MGAAGADRSFLGHRQHGAALREEIIMAFKLAYTAAAIAMIGTAALSAAPASAQPQTSPPPVVISRIDPADAVQMLQEAGYRAVISHSSDRSVDIESRMSGLYVYFSLFGCTEAKQCTSVQMRMTATLDFIGLANDRRSDVEAAIIATNRWSHHRRYVNSYVFFSESQNRHIIAFNTDLSLDGGATREAIGSFIRFYDKLSGEFVTFMRDPANRRMPSLSGS